MEQTKEITIIVDESKEDNVRYVLSRTKGFIKFKDDE